MSAPGGGKRILTVGQGDPREPVAFLVERLAIKPKASRALINRGVVWLDNRRINQRMILPLGARLIVRELPVDDSGEPRVVYEDRYILVVDKPAGLLSQGSAGETAPSVERWAKKRDEAACLMHRLDRETSGLLLVARTERARHAVQKAFVDGKIEKRYLAVAAGRIDGPRELRMRIGRSGEDPRRRMALPENAPGGESALTRIEPIAWDPAATDEPRPDCTPLLVELHTGRTHQIRAHLAGIGHPVVGDRLYGGPAAPRLLLHAARLTLRHPIHGAPLDLFAPSPPGLPPFPGAPASVVDAATDDALDPMVAPAADPSPEPPLPDTLDDEPVAGPVDA